MLLSWLKAFRALSLGLWAGGILMVFIAANAIFEKLKPDTNLAGTLVGEILTKGGKIKLGIGLIALALEALIFYGVAGTPSNGWRRFAPATFFMLALAIALTTSIWIDPAIHEIRHNPDFAIAPLDSDLRSRFSALHGASMGLTLLELIFVVFATVLGLIKEPSEVKAA